MNRKSPLKPKKPLAPMSAKKLAEFAKHGVKPASTLDKPGAKKAAVKVKRSRSTDPDPATVDAVLGRDDWRCLGCGDPLCGRRGIEYSVHHRKRRSQGGDNRKSNLVSLCGHGTSGCHGNVHSEIARARQAGFLLRSTENPAEVPLEHAVHGTILLDDLGGWESVVVQHDAKEGVQ